MKTSYRIKKKESLQDGIQRIVTEQVDRALHQLEHNDDDVHEAVHDSRKCFKKVRGVLRLLRDEIGEEVYKRENSCFRDAGRKLAVARDRAVMVETLDSLLGDVKNGRFADVTNSLAGCKEKAGKQS
jgi:hypothetical protein